MPGRLIIRLDVIPSYNVEWLICDENNILIEGSFYSPLSELTTKAHQYPVVLIVPGISLQILRTTIPRTTRANLIKAIPYAIEEQISVDVTKLHFALLDIQDEQQIIAVIDKAQMDDWLKPFAHAEINVQWMIPDLFALPVSGTTWYAVVDKDIILCSCGDQLKFSTDKSNFYEVIRLYLESEKFAKPNHIEILGDNLTEIKFPEGLMSIHGLPIHYTPLKKDSVFNYLVQHLPKNQALNLLQAEYQPQHTQSFTRKIWLLAAATACIWILTLVAKDLLQYRQLNTQQHLYQQRIEQLYYQVFPTATALVSPKVRFETELKHLQSASEGSPVLSLLAQATPTIKKSKNITIDNLEFKDQQLTLKIRSNNFQNIENLAAALKQKNLSVQQLEAQKSDSFVTSNIVIRNP